MNLYPSKKSASVREFAKVSHSRNRDVATDRHVCGMNTARMLSLAGILVCAAPLVANAQEPAAAPMSNEPLAAPTSNEPLGGWSDGTMFLRSPDNMFQLFPNGRLQVDGYFFKRDDLAGANPAGSRMPTDTILLRRARIEMFGWIGQWFGFNIAGDFALGAPAGADPVAQ